MLKLEDIRKDAQLRGIEPEGIVRVVTVEPVGADGVHGEFLDELCHHSTRILNQNVEH